MLADSSFPHIVPAISLLILLYMKDWSTRRESELKEIESEQNVSIEQIKSSNSSIKDEVLTIKITLIFIALFIPYTQPWMEKGFEILKNAPEEFWWAVLIVYSGSFGLSTVSKIRGKK